jgi:hypothetical protein
MIVYYFILQTTAAFWNSTRYPSAAFPEITYSSPATNDSVGNPYQGLVRVDCDATAIPGVNQRLQQAGASNWETGRIAPPPDGRAPRIKAAGKAATVCSALRLDTGNPSSLATSLANFSTSNGQIYGVAVLQGPTSYQVLAIAWAASWDSVHAFIDNDVLAVTGVNGSKRTDLLIS